MKKESLKIRKIQIRHRVPHERRQWTVPTSEKLLSILAHLFNFVIFTIIFNKKYNYEFIIFTLLLILLIKN